MFSISVSTLNYCFLLFFIPLLQKFSIWRPPCMKSWLVIQLPLCRIIVLWNISHFRHFCPRAIWRTWLSFQYELGKPKPVWYQSVQVCYPVNKMYYFSLPLFSLYSSLSSAHLFCYYLYLCTVRAPVFGRHQFFGTSEQYGIAHGSLLSGWMNYTYTACCWFPTSSNVLILPSQFWQIRFESCWLHCS